MAKEREYPKPKKGERVKCLACNGTGKVVFLLGSKRVKRSCYGCNGAGYHVA